MEQKRGQEREKSCQLTNDPLVQEFHPFYFLQLFLILQTNDGREKGRQVALELAHKK